MDQDWFGVEGGNVAELQTVDTSVLARKLGITEDVVEKQRLLPGDELAAKLLAAIVDATKLMLTPDGFSEYISLCRQLIVDRRKMATNPDQKKKATRDYVNSLFFGTIASAILAAQLHLGTSDIKEKGGSERLVAWPIMGEIEPTQKHLGLVAYFAKSMKDVTAEDKIVNTVLEVGKRIDAKRIQDTVVMFISKNIEANGIIRLRLNDAYAA